MRLPGTAALFFVFALGLEPSAFAEEAATGLTAPAPPSAPIRSRSGDILTHPRIVSFNGAEFVVEHDGGVARVPYEVMPPAVQRRYLRDPERAKEEAEELKRKQMTNEAQRKAIEDLQKVILLRKLQAAAQRGGAPAPTDPAAPGAKTERTRFEITLRKGEATDLEPLGGPPVILQFLNNTDTTVIYRKPPETKAFGVAISRGGLESAGGNLTPILKQSGITIYWVETLRRPTDCGIFLIEK